MTVIYFIKCFVSMGIAWSIYKLLLADKKSFLFNRAFLLLSIVGLAFVPFISLPSSVAPVVEPILPQFENLATYAVQFNAAPVEVLAPIATEASSTTTFQWIWLFYIVGFVLLLRIIFNIAKLSIAAFRNLHHSDGEVRIIDSNYKNTPFSFFNNLFLSSEQMEEGLPAEVLSHELCHINHYHSIDRIVVELILLIQWWNPFAHLLIRSLKENHEYTADDYALRYKGQSNRLMEQILSYSTKANSNHLFQIGFAQQFIVKRIKMINKESSVSSPFLVVFSVFVMIGVVISCTDFDENVNGSEQREVEIILVVDEHTELEYRYPKSLVDKVHHPSELTGFPEYRAPKPELFQKFVTDPTFEIYLNQEKLKKTDYKTLEHESIKSYEVTDMSHMNWNPDFRATLYTQDGYFKMMNVIITFLCDEMEAIRPKDDDVDLLYRSANKYNWTGGAPESEIPKPKTVSTKFFRDLKDPTKYRLIIDSHLADNTDLNGMRPSDFSYYVIENNSRVRDVNVHLLTHNHFKGYIDNMINGLSELD